MGCLHESRSGVVTVRSWFGRGEKVELRSLPLREFIEWCIYPLLGASDGAIALRVALISFDRQLAVLVGQLNLQPAVQSP